MRSPSQCREKSKELERRAKEISDPAGRKMLLETARLWQALGRAAESPAVHFDESRLPAGELRGRPLK